MPKKAEKVDFFQPEKKSCHTWELERITWKCRIVHKL